MCYTYSVTYSIVSMHEKKCSRLFSLKIAWITPSKENNSGHNTRDCIIDFVLLFCHLTETSGRSNSNGNIQFTWIGQTRACKYLLFRCQRLGKCGRKEFNLTTLRFRFAMLIWTKNATKQGRSVLNLKCLASDASVVLIYVLYWHLLASLN